MFSDGFSFTMLKSCQTHLFVSATDNMNKGKVYATIEV